RGAARGHRGAAGGPAPRVGPPRRRGVIVRRDRRDPRHRPGHRALATASRAPAIEGEAGAVRMTCTETRDLFSALPDDALPPALPRPAPAAADRALRAGAAGTVGAGAGARDHAVRSLRLGSGRRVA